MLINVKAGDIARGCQMHTSNCPVARAVARATGLFAVVTGSYIRVFGCEDDFHAQDWPRGIVKEWPTPEVAGQAIGLYDDTGLMEPFSFEL